MTTEPKITMDTLEGALVLLAESTFAGKAVPHYNNAMHQSRMRQAVRDVAALERIERSLKRMAEHACSFPMTEAENMRADKRRLSLAKKAMTIAAPYGVSLRMAGDVRGSQVRLLTPRTERSNTFGGWEGGWAL